MLYKNKNMKLPKYLVRPHDFHIWYLDEKISCYNSDKEFRWITRKSMTFENLTENHDFFPITEEQLPEYEAKSDDYMEFTIWQYRPDGHGGSKGGTRDEFEKYKERLERYQNKNKK